MKISVVIRTHNEAKNIERLLIGLGAQTLPPHEVILVDSSSTDATVAIARAYGVRVVEIDKAEFTFGHALNRGCAAASGDICVFASGHVYPVSTTWLETLVAPFAHDRVALSYGRQCGNETTKFSECQVLAQWFPPDSVCPQPSDFCNNANCAIRRSVWQEVPYDETLTGLEDIAWAKTARRSGHWVAYVAEAEVVHVHDETWPQVRNRYRREAMALRTIDGHSHFTRRDLARLLARNVASDLRAAHAQGCLRRDASSILLFRYNQLAGTYRGFNGPSEASEQLRARFYFPGENVRESANGKPSETTIDYSALEAEARRARLESDRRFPGDGTLLRPIEGGGSRAVGER